MLIYNLTFLPYMLCNFSTVYYIFYEFNGDESKYTFLYFAFFIKHFWIIIFSSLLSTLYKALLMLVMQQNSCTITYINILLLFNI